MLLLLSLKLLLKARNSLEHDIAEYSCSTGDLTKAATFANVQKHASSRWPCSSRDFFYLVLLEHPFSTAGAWEFRFQSLGHANSGSQYQNPETKRQIHPETPKPQDEGGISLVVL